MKTARWRSFVAGLVGLLALSGAAPAAPADALQRVVYHIDTGDPERQRAALRTLRNYLNEIGDDGLDIRVVLQGNGVTMLVRPDATDRQKVPGNATPAVQLQIEDLKLRGVRFVVCAHSLERRDIRSTARLFDVTPEDIVDSGLEELVRLQGNGYIYVKL